MSGSMEAVCCSVPPGIFLASRLQKYIALNLQADALRLRTIWSAALRTALYTKMRVSGCQAGVGHPLVLFPMSAPFTELALNRHGSRAPTGRRIPAQVQTLGTAPDTSTRSEGTPHIDKCRRHVRSILMRRSFRTHPRFRPFPGLHPSLVCAAPLGEWRLLKRLLA